MIGRTPGRWKDRPSRPWVGRTGQEEPGKTPMSAAICASSSPRAPHPPCYLLYLGLPCFRRQLLSRRAKAAEDGAWAHEIATMSGCLPVAAQLSSLRLALSSFRNAPRDPSGGRAGVGWRRASIIECELPRDAPPPARSSVLATEPPRNSRPFPPYPVTSWSCPLSRGRHADRLPHRSRAAQAGLPALLLIRCTTPGGPQPVCTLVSPKTEVAIMTLPLQRTLVRIK